jgi:hypothetical protein
MQGVGGRFFRVGKFVQNLRPGNRFSLLPSHPLPILNNVPVNCKNRTQKSQRLSLKHQSQEPM